MASALSGDPFIQSLNQTVGELKRAADLGRAVAPEIERIYMVACGAPYRLMEIVQFLADKVARTTEVRSFLSDDFIDMVPPKLDRRTLVFVASKSGETPETLEVAKFVGKKSYKTIVFTQSETSPLAAEGDEVFLLGKPEDPLLAISMLMYSIVGAVLEVRESWHLFGKLFGSLPALPKAFVAAAQDYDARAKKDAVLFKADDLITLVASGPQAPMAFVLGTSNLTEKLKIAAPDIKASDFFHGPHERVDKSTPLILLVGEDPSRQMIRVKNFCDKYAERVLIYDTRECGMEGIDGDVRHILAPLLIRAKMKVWVERLAEARGQSLTERTYMGKINY